MATLFSWCCFVWFFIWGYLKDKFSWTNPDTEEELSENTQLEVPCMSREQLQRVSQNLFEGVENVSELMGNICGICNIGV
jgi:hypothetical protein